MIHLVFVLLYLTKAVFSVYLVLHHLVGLYFNVLIFLSLRFVKIVLDDSSIFRWCIHLYISLFPVVCPSVRSSIRSSVARNISRTVHQLIIIFGTHVENDDISSLFFLFFFFFFFDILIFWAVGEVKRQKMAQNGNRKSSK